MAVTDYLQTSSGTCRYSYNKLKNVLYLVSAEHIKDVQIDNGEAYISGLTEPPLRINGFDIQFTEETSLDERYKFQKKITLSMNGYVNYKLFGGRYYAILEAEDGTYFMVNVDFPSRITHTFNLSKDVNQTDFTFACLSNFPTLKLDAEFEAVEPVCLGFRVNGIQSLQLIEKEKARLDVENKTVISTEDFKKIEYLGDSCSFSEVYDGFKVTDTIEFQIALDAYKPSWQYNLLEFLDNKYSAIIIPKGNDNKFYPGFNFGLEPSYVISTASQKGESDIITVTLTESSSYGTTAANDWDEDQSTETRWRWVKQVGDTICYECIGLRRARYLVRQQVDMFGNPTGDYQVMEGYESQYPNLNITGTFTTEQEFDSLDCGETGLCNISGNVPSIITFNASTCYTYSLRTSCAFEFKNIPANITVTPSTGNADTDYTVTICNSTVPSSIPLENTMFLSCCNSNRAITVKVQEEVPCVRPTTQTISCSAQTVQFTYDGECQLNVSSIDPRLTYSVSNNIISVSVPNNEGNSAITYTIVADNCNCTSGNTAFRIKQNKCEEPIPPSPGEPMYRWVNMDIETDYVCKDGCGCADPIYRWATNLDEVNVYGPYSCYTEYRQISYDGGITWENVYPINKITNGECTGCPYPGEFTDRMVAYFKDISLRVEEPRSSSNINRGDISRFTLYGSLSDIYKLSFGADMKIYESSAFKDCINLETITFPCSTTVLQPNLFACPKLESIYIEAKTPPTIYDGTFDNSNDCPIYVYSGFLNDYYNAWPISIWYRLRPINTDIR